LSSFFFFQADDGIRDFHVTGVQTCALPIYNLYCISDEVYEHMVFDGAMQLSANGFSELAARSFIVSSFGKTFHVTGWKLGYCVRSEERRVGKECSSQLGAEHKK